MGGGGDKTEKLSWQSLLIGAAIQVFEVTTLGQPFEVLKTHMAAHRQDGLRAAIVKTYQRGGIFGFYQGLIPWAWIEASTKGAVLLFAMTESEKRFLQLGIDPKISAVMAGIFGGLAQAYTTMGFCTFMKTVEVTRHKAPAGIHLSTWQVAKQVWEREGIRGLNRGVTAVAIRQMTNWGSRYGIAKIAKETICTIHGDPKHQLSGWEKVLASAIAGFLGCWNQPIEVIRVEMQNQAKSPDRPANLNIWTAAKFIYQKHGLIGFYRGIVPRICLGIYLTVLMVSGGDELKARYGS